MKRAFSAALDASPKLWLPSSLLAIGWFPKDPCSMPQLYAPNEVAVNLPRPERLGTPQAGTNSLLSQGGDGAVATDRCSSIFPTELRFLHPQLEGQESRDPQTKI